jgi:hypothetical protein
MRHIFIMSAFALGAAITAAQAAPAPSTIEGSWRGSGIVAYRNRTDRVECRVRYTPGGAQRYLVASQCETNNGHYDLTGTVARVGGNRYAGWVGSGRQTGRVELVQHGNRLAVTVTSRRGSARLDLARS